MLNVNIETPKINKRNFGIDLLKALAIFGVLVIHTCKYNYDISSFNWTSSVLWGSLVRASVPVFFMCSGALLLSPEYKLLIKMFFSKNVLRIIVAMLVWAMAYKVFHLLAGRNLTIVNLFQAIKEVLVFNQEFHLYFLQVIILVYLFLPITRIVTQNATKRQLEYLLGLWFTFGIVFPTVASFWPFTLLSDIALQYKINMVYAAIGYGVLGFYLRKYPQRGKTWYFVLAAAGFIITFSGTYMFSLIKGDIDTQFFEGMSVGVCLMAAGIFGLLVSADVPKNEKVKRAIVYISKASFCIYLSHMFFNYIFQALGITITLLPAIISIPLIASLLFICSTFVYVILSRIPVINEWII